MKLGLSKEELMKIASKNLFGAITTEGTSRAIAEAIEANNKELVKQIEEIIKKKEG